MDHGTVQSEVNSASSGRWLRWIGRAAVLVGLVFVIWRAVHAWDGMRNALMATSLTSVGAATLLYVCGALLLALSWPLLLRAFAGSQVPIRPLLVLHLQSQLSKYLPGGIFHFAHRHLASRSWDVPHRRLLLATATESALLVIAAGLIASTLGGQPRLATLAPWLPTALAWLPGSLLVAWLLVWIWHGYWARWLRKSIRWVSLPVVTLLDLVFFVLASIAFWLLLPYQVAPLAETAAWLCLAWMAGYLVPGAPGGLGVREAVLLLGLAPTVGEPSALAAALSYRMVTVLADAVCAGLGHAWGAGQDASS